MRQKLFVQKSEKDGLPYAIVPSNCMWHLVEYLSFQRMAVTYEYSTTEFTVSFLRTEMATAQKVLDDWSDSPAQLLELS